MCACADKRLVGRQILLQDTSIAEKRLVGRQIFATGHFDFVVLAVGHRPDSLLGETLHEHSNLPMDTAPIRIIISY